ncbi:MAG: endonuclease/exonuclease/phosphatase (EEP) superfamily protein YafD [Bradymonadia bacterium]|jgi:endonuclease/exonuclease/phosphatase (EEP) superfamily protein YafD
MSRFIGMCVRLGMSMAALVVVLGMFGERWWVFDLLNHFRVPLLFGLAFLFAIALLRRQLWMIGLGAMLLGWTLAGFAPLYLTQGEPATGGTLLVVEAYNVNRGSGDPKRVAAQLAASDADVIGLVEVDERWLRALEPALRRWPHRLTHAQADNFGLALYSTRPIADAVVIDRKKFAFIRAQVDVEGTPVGLLLVHPPPPMGAEWAAYRDAAFVGYGQILSDMPAESVVLGDLNATPWSRPFLAMLKANNLREARDLAGAGLRATWPAGSMLPRVLPIDHVLVRGALGVDVFEVLGANGSDHHPVRAVLRLGGLRVDGLRVDGQ